MQDIALPRHVIAKVEGRWASRLARQVQAMTAELASQDDIHLIPIGIKPARQLALEELIMPRKG